MRHLASALLFVTSIAVTAAFAALPSDAPKGSMGMCKDGTYSSAAEKKGACRGHKGVKEWYGDSHSAASTPPVGTHVAAGAASSVAMPGAVKSVTPDRGASPSSTLPAAVPGGGAGKVWGNAATKVYHCIGDKYYGATKQGEYMSESDAKSRGFHASHGKACG